MDKAIQYLIDCKERLILFLRNEIVRNRYDYETFGKKIESPLLSEIISILDEGGFLLKENHYRSIFHKSVTGLIYKKVISARKRQNLLKRSAASGTILPSNKPYRVARNKNDFPDLTLFRHFDIAVEVKAGNRSEYNDKAGRWVACNNSNNDLGTLNSWPDKIKQFGGENIYFLFIEYNFTNERQEIIDIKIDRFYRFIGLNEVGLLSYREKDGNLRPKNFDVKPPIETFEQFQSLFQPTVIYRSKNIIRKHIVNVPDAQRNEFLESLKI
ncbi:MAG TPA: hypothetical protein VF658_00360 [Pyrinomonadaceae bacterium]|jgi:hypothetical protein